MRAHSITVVVTLLAHNEYGRVVDTAAAQRHITADGGTVPPEIVTIEAQCAVERALYRLEDKSPDE